MTKLEIRDYTEGDYEKYIQSLTKENMQKLFLDNFGGWSDEVSKNKFFKVLADGYVKLFFLEDSFIGYVTFNQEENNKDSYLINDIHIVKTSQGKGYGTEILNFVISECEKLNAKQMKLFVFKENPAINFYKKNGFKEIEFIEKSKTCVMTLEIKT
jgi:GNAT superfamily N-acetyltransferase